MKSESTDFEIYTKYQHGARLRADADQGHDYDLAQLMLLVKSEYGRIKDETRLPGRGFIYIDTDRCRHLLVDLASRAWQAVAAIDNKHNLAGFNSVREEAAELFVRKNADYGDSYKSHGSAGVIVRLSDKVQRASRLHANISHQVKSESLRDTLMDMGNYALMALILIERESSLAA